MPLEPPYELEMFNSLDEAGISEWKSNKSILGGVSQYAKQGHYVAGRYTNPFQGKNESGYFIFDFETGVLQKFDQEGVFNKACKDFGLTSPVTLKSVKDNWNLYWDDPNRRRK